MKRCAVVLMAAIAVVAMSGCEPSMTITAKPNATTLACGEEVVVSGKVTPANGTKKVAVQETVGGRWVDSKGWQRQEDLYTGSIGAITANLHSDGSYLIPYVVDWGQTTKHLRVRSNGGGAFSPSFYVKSDGVDGDC